MSRRYRDLNDNSLMGLYLVLWGFVGYSKIM